MNFLCETQETNRDKVGFKMMDPMEYLKYLEFGVLRVLVTGI